MLNPVRLTLMAVTAFLGAGLSVSSLGAQASAKPANGGMVDEKVVINMPFVLRNFSPAIDRVKAVCRVFQSDGSEVSSKESVPQKTTPRNADGSLSGTLVTVHEFKRAAMETGMQGHYHCVLAGETISGSGEAFSVGTSNPVFYTPSGKNEAVGIIAW